MSSDYTKSNMKKDIVIAAYAEGIGYNLNSQIVKEIGSAGWTNIILCLLHPQGDGSIFYNDTLIIENGIYKGNDNWPSYVAALKEPGIIKKISASVGGGGVGDFKNIYNIYNKNKKSFEGTALQQNFQALKDTVPAIDIIDMDCEDKYDSESFIAFCEMLIKIGFSITFCPYANTNMAFWVESLSAIAKNFPGCVLYWNLQCYDGGAGNDPQYWAQAINKKLPDFNTENFITAGDWTHDSPFAVGTLLKQFSSESCTNGAFLWTLDDIYPAKMENYITAIKNAFS